MTDHLNAGERLERGQYLESNNKKFKLYLRSNGDVKLFKFEPGRKRALGRISGYRCTDEGFLWLTPRGYLFGGWVHPELGNHYGWVRPRNGLGPSYEGARMFLQDDGNLVIRDANGDSIWSTQTYGAHRNAINPDHRVISITGGSLAIDNSRTNTIIENPHRETVTVTDGDNALELERGEPHGIWAPRGAGSLAVSGASYTYDLDSDRNSSDQMVRYESDSVARRTGNTWTVQAGSGSWLVDPNESVSPAPAPGVLEGGPHDWVDYGMTQEDEESLSGKTPVFVNGQDPTRPRGDC